MSANAPETANDSADAKARARTPSSGRALPRRLTWALTVLAFTAIAAVAIYALSLIWEAALLLLLSALLAYFIYPLTELLRRRLKRPLAITVAYLLVAGLLALVVWIPVVGGYVIEALCILAALPEGWMVMLIVTVYMSLLQGLVLGLILSPRIFSKTVGVHPIVALFALVAGAELFGLLGGFLSVPVAGVLQQIVVALWKRWKSRHPDQFPAEESPPQQAALLPAERVTSGDAPVPGARFRH
jgi:predicted PurR-regulated permease PerM